MIWNMEMWQMYKKRKEKKAGKYFFTQLYVSLYFVPILMYYTFSLWSKTVAADIYLILLQQIKETMKETEYWYRLYWCQFWYCYQIHTRVKSIFSFYPLRSAHRTVLNKLFLEN